METVQIECRCKDCEYCDKYDTLIKKEKEYLFYGYCLFCLMNVNKNDFCSNGVRKENQDA